MKFVRTFGLALLFCSMAAMLGAQGVQTGTVRGVVQDEQGLAVPGVTVTVTSPALQGPRADTSDATGGFVFPNLPPGPYTVTFELSGFATVTQNTNVPLGGIIQQNVTMRTAGAHRNGAGRGRVAGADCDARRRREHQARGDRGARHAAHACRGSRRCRPASTSNTPNGGQLVINGGFAFDNIFMVNGVDVNDNLFGIAQNLFIEDAIEETQVLTSGISARVRPLLRRRGQRHHQERRQHVLGQLPGQLPQPGVDRRRRRSRSQNDVTRTGHSSTGRYEATFGGPIAQGPPVVLHGRPPARQSNTADAPGDAACRCTQDDENKRGEIKLTGNGATEPHDSGRLSEQRARRSPNTSGLCDADRRSATA